jgi:hypothetical protein
MDYKHDQETFNTNICELIVNWEEIQFGDQDRGRRRRRIVVLEGGPVRSFRLGGISLKRPVH